MLLIHILQTSVIGEENLENKGLREKTEKPEKPEKPLEKAKASFTQTINEPRVIYMLEGSSWIWKT
jgi:hypothetical protein